MSSSERGRRPLYAPPPRRAQRSTLATYAPLVLTLGLATAGLAAWIWTERRSTSDDDEDVGYRKQVSGSAPPEYRSTASGSTRQDGLLDRAGGYVSGTVGAGVAAVSGGVAAAGTALGLYNQDERADDPSGSRPKGKRAEDLGKEKEDGFSDHERWSEEAVSRKASSKPSKQGVPSGKRRAVAVVVSAEGELEGVEDSIGGLEHASILSHLPLHHDPNRTNLFVLIYAPHLANLQTAESQPGLSGSYSTISLPGGSSSNRLYSALREQAEALVSNPAQLLPFSSPTGYVHMLRHLAPSLVYLQDGSALSGARGENLALLKGWVGQTVVVVGDDGSGGLADTETETEDEGGAKGKGRLEPWYQVSDLVGLGKGVEVVDVRQVGDDWSKRVLG